MRKTPLKRYTPLRAKTGLKRTAMKIKPKRYPIPKDELTKIDERANGRCEWCGTRHYLENAHIIHRGMGGVQGIKAVIINDHRNILRLCNKHHNIFDGRVNMLPKEYGMRELLKDKSSWAEWYEENKDVIKR